MGEVTLKIKLPDKDTKGFLRRSLAASTFTSMIAEKNFSPEYFTNLITFILDFVEKPVDKEEARRLLLDASENEYMQIMDAIRGVANPTEPEENGKS